MTSALLKLPFVVLGSLMFFDEFVFHRRRGLGRWEALGHPVDTLSVVILLVIASFTPCSSFFEWLFLVLAVFSCVLITKDEFIHTKECKAAENHLHALLFVLHPVLLFSIYSLWSSAAKGEAQALFFLRGQLALVFSFGAYQLWAWRGAWRLPRGLPSKVNLKVYEELGDRWYTAEDDPIALLRAESRFRNPWVVSTLREAFEGALTPRSIRVLDLGCGGGFLANALAEQGFQVVGLDRSPEALAVARRHDSTGRVDYQCGDAGQLPFPAQSFDAVALMDFLEHVEDPALILREVSRVLKPGGLWLFHTFNRTRVADWVAIRAVDTFVANVPENLHLFRLFIRPRELEEFGRRSGLSTEDVFGARPALDPRGLFHLAQIALMGRVPGGFRFIRTPSLKVGYLGWGKKIA